MQQQTWWRGRSEAVLLGLGIVVANVYVCRELFRIEYLRHMGSIEGAYFGISRYAMTHWPDLRWFPPWYDGIPYQNTYPPMLHWVVAIVAWIAGLSAARGHHVVTAAAYCLGPVTIGALCWRLSRSKWSGFVAGLLYTCLSISAWLIPVVAKDMGGVFHPRRLQALVFYGEGPHVSALTLLPLTILFLDLALEEPRAFFILLTTVAMAATALTNWIAAFALAILVACYVLARIGTSQWRWSSAAWIAVTCAAVYLLAMPWAPPSTVSVIQHNSATIGGDFRGIYDELPRWGVVLAISLGVLKMAVRRVPMHIQFAIFFSSMTGAITLGWEWFHVALVPQPARYHLEMEMALVILLAFAGHALISKYAPRSGWVVVALLVACMIVPLRLERRYARTSLLLPIDITSRTEWKVADWFNKNWNGGRVMVAGSTALWLTAFTDTPQLGGGFDQGTTDYSTLVAIYGICTGEMTNGHDAEYSILWMKALGIQAIAVDGPESTEVYRAIRDPHKFDGVLEPIANTGGATIYRVGRPNALARVVPRVALVGREPINAIDVEPLRPYVAALDDASMPAAEFRWTSMHSMRIAADLREGQVISVQTAWHKGWHAVVNGRSIPVLRDGIGLMYLEPSAAGHVDIEMYFDGGTELRLANVLSSLTAVLLLALCGWQFVRAHVR